MKLDVRGEICPYPMMKAVEAMSRLAEGDVLEVITDHPPALETIPTQARRRGLAYAVSGLGPSEWQISIYKGGAVEAAERVARTVDLKGQAGPGLVAHVQQELQGMGSGQVLQVLVDKRAAVASLSLGLGDAGHGVLEVTQVGPSAWTVAVRKG